MRNGSLKVVDSNWSVYQVPPGRSASPFVEPVAAGLKPAFLSVRRDTVRIYPGGGDHYSLVILNELTEYEYEYEYEHEHEHEHEEQPNSTVRVQIHWQENAGRKMVPKLDMFSIFLPPFSCHISQWQVYLVSTTNTSLVRTNTLY